MIPALVAARHRVLAPDLIGFGKSDKPARRVDYTYANHLRWPQQWLTELDLRHITLVVQDWGGLLGLRLATQDDARFARIVAANTALPVGWEPFNPAFALWWLFSQVAPGLPIGGIIQAGGKSRLSTATRAAYAAPFPDKSYQAGARQFPVLVPTKAHDPEAAANRQAWLALRQWHKPFLTAFSDGDPIMRGYDRVFQQLVPGAQGQPHVTIRGAGHFLQEDKGQELAAVVADFIVHPGGQDSDGR